MKEFLIQFKEKTMTGEDHFKNIAEELKNVKTKEKWLKATVLIAIITTTIAILMAVQISHDKKESIQISKTNETCKDIALAKNFDFYHTTRIGYDRKKSIKTTGCLLTNDPDRKNWETILISNPNINKEIQFKSTRN